LLLFRVNLDNFFVLFFNMRFTINPQYKSLTNLFVVTFFLVFGAEINDYIIRKHLYRFGKVNIWFLNFDGFLSQVLFLNTSTRQFHWGCDTHIGMLWVLSVCIHRSCIVSDSSPNSPALGHYTTTWRHWLVPLALCTRIGRSFR